MDVEKAHENKHKSDQAKDGLRTHVALGAGEFGLLLRRLAQIAEGSPQARRKTVAHSVERVSSAYQHSANCDGTNDKSPHRGRQGSPVIGRIGGEILFELR